MLLSSLSSMSSGGGNGGGGEAEVECDPRARDFRVVFTNDFVV
ncbi:hypothetical protein TIFTF001_023429 [Ficus carica]|uniref:Uncharacterized protein n=1 Tax=Ficus carica TaxID=3494 RepID=A0AA88DG87_FICCA|nr:hypothetical protein TIFTF001_023429 [Ficus carica]